MSTNGLRIINPSKTLFTWFGTRQVAYCIRYFATVVVDSVTPTELNARLYLHLSTHMSRPIYRSRHAQGLVIETIGNSQPITQTKWKKMPTFFLACRPLF